MKIDRPHFNDFNHVADYYKESYKLDALLLKNIKENYQDFKYIYDLIELFTTEDRIYRFYHQSMKVFQLQELTKQINELLILVHPCLDNEMDAYFIEIIEQGTTIGPFKMEYNQHWMTTARPIVEAYFHAEYFLKQIVKYGKLDKAPEILPSGWAALLELYNIR